MTTRRTAASGCCLRSGCASSCRSSARACARGVRLGRRFLLEPGQGHAVILATAAAAALAATDQHGAAAPIEIRFGERERLLDAHPGPPEDHDHAAQAAAVHAVAGGAHDGDDLLDGW